MNHGSFDVKPSYRDLNLNGGNAAFQLIIGMGIALAMLVVAIVVAQRRKVSGVIEP